MALFSSADELLGNGESKGAESFLREALQLSLTNLGVAHEMIVTSQEELGTVLAQLGKYDEAIEINMAAWMTRERARDTSRRRHTAHLNLARDLVHMGRFQEAASHIERAYTSQINDMQSFGPAKPSTLRTGCELGTYWFSLGHRAKNDFLRNKANMLHEEVLKLQLQVEGIDEVDIICMRAALAEDLYRLGHDNECESLLVENMRALTAAIDNAEKGGIKIGRGGTEYRRQELETILERSLNRKGNLENVKAELAERERTHLAEIERARLAEEEKECQAERGRDHLASIERARQASIEGQHQARIEQHRQAEEAAERNRVWLEKIEQSRKDAIERALQAERDRALQTEEEPDRPETQTNETTTKVIMLDDKPQLKEEVGEIPFNISGPESVEQKGAEQQESPDVPSLELLQENSTGVDSYLSPAPEGSNQGNNKQSSDAEPSEKPGQDNEGEYCSEPSIERIAEAEENEDVRLDNNVDDETVEIKLDEDDKEEHPNHKDSRPQSRSSSH